MSFDPDPRSFGTFSLEPNEFSRTFRISYDITQKQMRECFDPQDFLKHVKREMVRHLANDVVFTVDTDNLIRDEIRRQLPALVRDELKRVMSTRVDEFVEELLNNG